MPVTIKSRTVNFRETGSDQFVGVDTIAETSTAQQVAAIEAAGAEQIDALEDKGEEIIADWPQDYSTLTNDVSDLKSQMPQITGYTPIRFTENGSISIGGTIGAIISLTPNSTNSTDYIVQDCSSGDRFLLTGDGWHTERLWAFIDNSNALLTESAANETAAAVTLVAPANAAKLIVNAKRASVHYVYLCGSSFPLESAELKSAVNTIDGLQIVSFTRDNTIVTNGSTVDVTKLSASNTGLCCAVVDCQPGDVFTISGAGASSARLWCFIDSSGNSLSVASANATLNNGIVTAPANSAKIVINARNPFAVKGKLVSKRLYDLENETRFAPTNQNIISDTVSGICSGNANNIPNNNIYGINIAYTSISNMPPYPAGVNGTYQGTVITFGKESGRGYGDMQIYIQRAANGGMYVRNYTNTWSAWKNINPVVATKVLGIGDSICEGWRNNNMGFAGMLGLEYRNLGVTGATLGQKSGHTQICDEIESETITEDLVIANGGINDYYFEVPLGSMSSHPVVNDTQAAALDKSTLSGGLEYLLYLIIKKAPKAQRYFLITHKTRNFPYTPCYTGGYTQQEMHDRIVAICKLYNTKVIDVYEESVINSEFDEYISPTAYSNSNTGVTKQYYVDADRIHPLWLGYQAGYLPVMLRAIESAVMT